jgi:eukaryotic-like serine/threonine-protein kinase
MAHFRPIRAADEPHHATLHTADRKQRTATISTLFLAIILIDWLRSLAMLQPGQLFAGRYRVERSLAQGGMGVIYAAEHLTTEERVALKVLWPHVLGSASAVEKFQLEARLAARIGSEHVVRILDAGFDDVLAMPYLAMELLRGQTLQDIVTDQGPLPPAETLAVLRQVAKALDKAHTSVDREGRLAPVVHRDLKPENIFVALREEGEPIVKILDFGIAKVLTQSQKLSQEVRGTPRFMAYEQLTNGPVTPRLDVWALGLIAFYLLTGRSYWKASAGQGSDLVQLLTEVLALPFELPSVRAKALNAAVVWPATVDAWFFRCVNRTLEERFDSAGAAINALGEALGLGTQLSEANLALARVRLGKKVTPSATLSRSGAADPKPWRAEQHATHAVALANVSFTEPSGIVELSSWPPEATNELPERVAKTASGTTTESVAKSLLPKRLPSSVPGRRRSGLAAGVVGLVMLLGVILGRHFMTGAPPTTDVTSTTNSALPRTLAHPSAESEAQPVIVAPLSAQADSGAALVAASSLSGPELPPRAPDGGPKSITSESDSGTTSRRARDGVRDERKRAVPRNAASEQFYSDR